MKQVNHLQLVEALNMHYQAKIPLFIRGEFGIGKSQIVAQVSDKLSKTVPYYEQVTETDPKTKKQVQKTVAVNGKRKFVAWNQINKKEKMKVYENPKDFFVLFDERLSQYEPSDLRGLPKFSDGGETVEWKIPRYLSFCCKEHSAGIIFFDEMNNAAPSIMKAAYQIFLDRGIGDYRITDDWGIVAAGNRTQDRADVFDIPGPLRDRMSEIELIVDTEVWLEWATNNKLDSSIIGFIKFQPDMLLYTGEKSKKDSNSNKRRGGNVSNDMKATTPRGWDRVNTFLKILNENYTVRNATYYAQLSTLVESTMSDVASTKFSSFVKLKDRVDVDGILKNPNKIKDFDEIDVKYAIIGALIDRYKTNKNKYIAPLSEVAVAFKENKLPDFCVLLLRMMTNESKQFIYSNLTQQKAWSKLEDVFKKYLVK